MKLWTFGDSFTWGYMCKPGQEYYESTQPKKIWPELLSDNLGAELKNYSLYGYSNYSIVKTIAEHLHEIDKEDIVVVGTSSPFRLLRYNKIDGQIDDSVDHWKNINTPDYWDNKVLVDYLTEEVMPYEEEWNDYFVSLINNMLHPYDSYIWNWKLREQFETIKQETNDEIWDDHWSWTGHQQMYEWLIGVIDER
tara:strand:+ start:113 stop:694 length:582 start_codon:yes stop_codon:yes gene_type:complete